MRRRSAPPTIHGVLFQSPLSMTGWIMVKILAKVTTSSTTPVASSVDGRFLKITNGRSRWVFALKNGKAMVRNR